MNDAVRVGLLITGALLMAYGVTLWSYCKGEADKANRKGMAGKLSAYEAVDLLYRYTGRSWLGVIIALAGLFLLLLIPLLTLIPAIEAGK